MWLTLGSLLSAASLLVSTAPETASIRAVDNRFEDTANPSSSTVAIAQGGRVTFAYPAGANNHNVAFLGAQPTSCSQTAPPAGGTVPPLPPSPSGPGWSGECRFDAAATYSFVCQQHPNMTGAVVVEPASTPPPPGDPTPPPGDPTPSPGPSPGPSGGGPSGTPSNRFSISRVRARASGVVRVSLTLPGPGRLAVRETYAGGRTFARRRLDVRAAGPLVVRVKPNAAGRRALRRATRSLTVGLRVGFTPTGGERRTISRSDVRIPLG